MENYITIKGEDLEKVHWETNYGRTSFINYDKNGEKYAHEQFLPANLSIPKSLVQQKVKMTQAEKDEFEKVQRNPWVTTLAGAFIYINKNVTPILYERLFNDVLTKSSQAQNEFARAWADPSLIEVIPEKRWNVKIPPFSRTNQFYYKYGKHLSSVHGNHNDDEDQQFTESELKEYGLDDDMYEKEEVTDDGTK